MVAVPAVTPLTTPAEPTVATLAAEVIHVPPAGAEVNVVVEPPQTVAVPVITSGNGVTVTVLVLTQPPLARVKVIVAVPVAVPVDTPEILPIEATEALLLVQPSPPPVTSLKVAVVPIHIVDGPVMGAGATTTVISWVL